MHFKDKDLQVHVPSGAVPKDGPSAGIALFMAFASLITGIAVGCETGHDRRNYPKRCCSSDWRIKKLLAADRAGITKVLIPKDNVTDLKDIIPTSVVAIREILKYLRKLLIRCLITQTEI
ncbi:lon protease (S16) C-terminal proteolytic domain protein [Desulfosporosinus sp. OT]|nr:lon protease (S16) C-terminal proteolytic domain protein [Desulfosporosinus sp. OT]